MTVEAHRYTSIPQPAGLCRLHHFLTVFLNQSPFSEWDSISFCQGYPVLCRYWSGGVGEWGSDGLKQIKYWHCSLTTRVQGRRKETEYHTSIIAVRYRDTDSNTRTASASE